MACFNNVLHCFCRKLFLGRRSLVSVSPTIPELREMTISIWMRTQQQSEGTVLSYATENQPKGLVITTHPRLTVILNVYRHYTSKTVTLNDGNWHFLSVTWSARTGIFAVRGREETYIWTTRRHSKKLLQGGGYLVLGKCQIAQKEIDEAGAFVVEISNLNIWDISKSINPFPSKRFPIDE